MPDEGQRVLGVQLDELGDDVGDDEVALRPGFEEARVDEAAFAFVDGDIVAFGGVGDVFLLVEGEVGERVDDGVGSTEGDDDARGCRGVGERDVAAGVREGEACVPGLWGGGLAVCTHCCAYVCGRGWHLLQLEAGEVFAEGETLEGGVDAGVERANAVGDVHDPRELLELVVEVLGYGVILGGRGGGTEGGLWRCRNRIGSRGGQRRELQTQQQKRWQSEQHWSRGYFSAAARGMRDGGGWLCRESGGGGVS